MRTAIGDITVIGIAHRFRTLSFDDLLQRRLIRHVVGDVYHYIGNGTSRHSGVYTLSRSDIEYNANKEGYVLYYHDDMSCSLMLRLSSKSTEILNSNPSPEDLLRIRMHDDGARSCHVFFDLLEEVNVDLGSWIKSHRDQ